jgi:hypothetical protein
MELQPLLELQILVHPTSARVEYQKAQLQRASLHQVLLDELFPLGFYVLRDPSVPVSRQIDEVKFIADPIEIDQLRASGPCAGIRQPLATSEAIQQTRLADVASPEKCNLRQRLGWKLIRPGSTDHKFGVYPALVHPTPNA